MKKIIALTLAACMLLTFTACGSEPRTETRYAMQTQIYEAPDNVICQETVFHYTDDGKIVSMVTTENGAEASRVNYELNEDGLLWKQITIADGASSTMEYTYTLDDAGNPIRVEQTQDGQPYSTSERTYDGEGNLLTQKNTYALNGMTSTITYDASGNILELETDYGEGRVYGTEYTYDEKGNPLTSVTDDAAGQRRTVYEYDAQGRETGTTEYLEDGSVNQYSETTYDGLTETIRSYGGDGTMHAYSVTTRDEHGNILTQEHYDQNESLMFRQSFTWLALEVPAD